MSLAHRTGVRKLYLSAVPSELATWSMHSEDVPLRLPLSVCLAS